MRDLTKPSTDKQSPFIAARARAFFETTFRGIVDRCGSSEVIEEMIKDEQIAASIERLGNEGHLDEYLDKKWKHVTGIDIKYSGTKQGIACHQFILEIDGKTHDTFLYPFNKIRNASRN